MEDTIRILRIVEYTGPRSAIEEQVRNSIHGERKVVHGTVTIRAATVGEFPEILSRPEPFPKTWKDYEMSVRTKNIVLREYPNHTPASLLLHRKENGLDSKLITRKIMAEIEEIARLQY